MKNRYTSYVLVLLSIMALLVLGSGCSTRLGLGFGFGSGGSSLSLGVSTSLPREKASVWAMQGKALLSEDVQEITLVFPKKGKAEGSVWGTDTYAEKSTIGMAAVHSGLITFEDGGVVTVRREHTSNTYWGSTRNGIVSRSSKKTSYGFSFVTEEV